jgi:hypothetical protein
MYGFNVPARFKTSKGSEYDVTAGGVQRFKKKEGLDLGLHGGEGKNIFYVDPVHRETMLGFSDLAGRKIRADGPDAIYLEDLVGEETRSVRLERSPEKGLRPFDVFVNSDGSFPSSAHRHLGHEIVEIS